MKDAGGRIPRFYVDSLLRPGGSSVLPEGSAHHALHVMRLRAGDELVLFNGRGGEYAARIASVDRLRVAVDVLAHDPVERESPLHVTLLQGVSSGERMDLTVRKAVELGVAVLQPLLAARSVARPKGERAEGRREHWQKVAIAACEQCGRNKVPEVLPLLSATAWHVPPGESALQLLLLSPRAELPLSRAVRADCARFVLASGPEAGFTKEEEAALADAGFAPVTLGARILRTETAAVAALAALSALRGDS